MSLRNGLKRVLAPLSTRERWLLALSVALLGLLLIGGRQLPEAAARAQPDTSLFRELKVFTDVLSIVERDYVKDVGGKQLVEGAIKGMLATLDPHSGYLDPDFYQDLQVQTRGEFGGLGIEITIKDGTLVVVAPMEGSPAEKAGVRAGDAIVKIDGKYTKEFSLVDAVKRLRGPKGSSLIISVQRKGHDDLVDLTVVRDNIVVKSVKFRDLGDGLGYVRISQFVERTTEDLIAAIGRLHRTSPGGTMKGLVIDLRNNPGGLLTQAIGVSDLFLNEGVIVYTEGRASKQQQKFFAHEANTEGPYPLVVLVNGGSASASEIVAGALKDHGRALILGTQTFGKGSVQTITPLENGGALTLTTALYYTKSGHSLQALGVSPDINMPDNAVEAAAAEQAVKRPELIREGDLPGAIENPERRKDDPLKKINKTPAPSDSDLIDPEKEDLGAWLKKDPQLNRAVELLKTFNIFKAA